MSLSVSLDHRPQRQNYPHLCEMTSFFVWRRVTDISYNESCSGPHFHLSHFALCRWRAVWSRGRSAGVLFILPGSERDLPLCVLHPVAMLLLPRQHLVWQSHQTESRSFNWTCVHLFRRLEACMFDSGVEHTCSRVDPVCWQPWWPSSSAFTPVGV